MEIESLLLVALFLVCFISSVVLNRVLLKFSSNLGVRNNDISILRWNQNSKPALGGIAFFTSFICALVFYFATMSVWDLQIDEKQVFGLLLACSMGFFMGFADDAYNTKPLLKFLVQFLTACVLIFSGYSVEIFSSSALNYLFTCLWVVGMMNSINMLDNMDAISTLASLAVFVSVFVIAFSSIEFERSFLLFSIVSSIASLAAFLFYNWNPSKMFMGDAGSQFLGVLLSVAGIHYLFNAQFFATDAIIIHKPFLLIFLAFLMPLTDTFTVSVNRILKGQSPFVGGRDHTTHFLSYYGFSDAGVAKFVLAIAVFSVVAVTAVFSLNSWFVDALFFAGGCMLFSALFLLTKVIDPMKKEIKEASVAVSQKNANLKQSTSQISSVDKELVS